MKQIFYTSVIFISFITCSRYDAPVIIPADRTVIIYMSADNDMSGDAFVDIEEMKEGFSGTGANLAVFIDPAGESPYLLEIAENAETKVKTYPEFNSADASQMRGGVERYNGNVSCRELWLDSPVARQYRIEILWTG
jgi:hypothetical protein